MHFCGCLCPMDFYPRPPRGGRPVVQASVSKGAFISIHALREEGDVLSHCPLADLTEFLSTPSARRATNETNPKSIILYISIHALREEGDEITQGQIGFACQFLSTPSARRATSRRKSSITFHLIFLSTPSARRATLNFMAHPNPLYDFYPRPPRGGRPLLSVFQPVAGIISIHALREEGDSCCRSCYPPDQHFYPRPPRGGRPVRGSMMWQQPYFYPRPPRGGRRKSRGYLAEILAFLSTPSARRATGLPRRSRRCWSISIHALREEGDTDVCTGYHINNAFLSTPSARRATCPSTFSVPGNVFLSTPSARRATG